MNVDSVTSVPGSGGAPPSPTLLQQKVGTVSPDKKGLLSSANAATLGKLASFLFDGSADPVPITEETHPVFYHATKNDGKDFKLIQALYH